VESRSSHTLIQGSVVVNDYFTVSGYQDLLSRQANSRFWYTTNPDFFQCSCDRDSVALFGSNFFHPVEECHQNKHNVESVGFLTTFLIPCSNKNKAGKVYYLPLVKFAVLWR
jgi:hypothetical protein